MRAVEQEQGTPASSGCRRACRRRSGTGDGSEGRAARLERRGRAGRARRDDGGAGRRRRGPEGQAQPLIGSRCATATRAARSRSTAAALACSAREHDSADSERGGAEALRALRRPRSADARGLGADARRRLAAQVGAGDREPSARARRLAAPRRRARPPLPGRRCVAAARHGRNAHALTRLGIRGRFGTTLQSTNPIESLIEIVRRTSRNVKR